MTDWLIQGCDYSPGWFPLYPSRVVLGGVKAYYWNERCLHAPKPYLEDGFYALDPRRRVRLGLLPVPRGFTSVPDTSLLVQALKNMMSHTPYTNNAVKKLLEHVDDRATLGTTDDYRPCWDDIGNPLQL